MDPSIVARLRAEYHRRICSEILAKRKETNAINIADVSSKASSQFAVAMARKMGHPLCANAPSGQTAGTRFTACTMDFVQLVFDRLIHLRPGRWVFSTSTAKGIAQFDQYEHLAALEKLVKENPELATTLGMEYIITPDIVVFRSPFPMTRSMRKRSWFQAMKNRPV